MIMPWKVVGSKINTGLRQDQKPAAAKIKVVQYEGGSEDGEEESKTTAGYFNTPIIMSTPSKLPPLPGMKSSNSRLRLQLPPIVRPKKTPKLHKTPKNLEMENCPGGTFKKLTDTNQSFDKNTDSGSVGNFLGMTNQGTDVNLYTKDSPKEGYDSILS